MSCNVCVADTKLAETCYSLTDCCDRLCLDLRLDVLTCYKSVSVTAGFCGTEYFEELGRIRYLNGICSVAHQGRCNVPAGLSCVPVCFPVVKCNIAGSPFKSLDLAHIDVKYALCVRTSATCCK